MYLKFLRVLEYMISCIAISISSRIAERPTLFKHGIKQGIFNDGGYAVMTQSRLLITYPLQDSHQNILGTMQGFR